MAPLAQSLAQVALSARDCTICGNIGTADPCDICADPRRATGEICVVETVADLWAMERGHAFKGRYHVLGGTLSALDAVGPDELRIPRLVARVADESVTEVILALNATVDGADHRRITSPTRSPRPALPSARWPRACRSAANWIISTTAPSARPSGRENASDRTQSED